MYVYECYSWDWRNQKIIFCLHTAEMSGSTLLKLELTDVDFRAAARILWSSSLTLLLSLNASVGRLPSCQLKQYCAVSSRAWVVIRKKSQAVFPTMGISVSWLNTKPWLLELDLFSAAHHRPRIMMNFGWHCTLLIIFNYLCVCGWWKLNEADTAWAAFRTWAQSCRPDSVCQRRVGSEPGQRAA